MSDLPVETEITPVSASDKDVVARLIQLYLYDFSEFAPIGSPYGEATEDGLFAYPWLDEYWTEPGRYALFIRCNQRLAGFALVNKWSASGKPVDWGMAEFFVMRKYRRAGIGTRAARKIIQRHPGEWEIPVAHYNIPAQHFWIHATSGLPDTRINSILGDGSRWSGPILRFVSQGGDR